jgi:outer membrane protein assembly factor BamA
MRGFPDGRFRGPSGLVGSIEYRWFVAYNLDAFLFADLGTVAGDRFAGLAQSHLFPSFGAGIRRLQPTTHYWEAPLLDGFQVAYAPEAGVRLMFSVAAF